MTTTTPTPTDSEAARQPDHSRERALPRTLRQNGSRIGLLVLVLALLGTTIYLTVQQRQDDEQIARTEALNSARAEALDAARAHAGTIASYHYRELDAYFEAVRVLATGDFAQQYDEANENLRSVLRRTKAIVTAKVVDAAVQTATADRAVVLLFIDQEVQNVATNGTATDRNRMRMTLEQHDDRWLVSDLDLK